MSSHDEYRELIVAMVRSLDTSEAKRILSTTNKEMEIFVRHCAVQLKDVSPEALSEALARYTDTQSRLQIECSTSSREFDRIADEFRSKYSL